MSKTILELLSLNPVYCDDLHDYFKCLICKDVMKNACFTPCGCEFCEQCIKNYLSNGDKVCPGHEDNFRGQLLNFDKDVNMNPVTNKKISQLRVKCVKVGCSEVDTIERMCEHVKKCGGNEMSCPFADIGCENSGNADRNELASHMLEEMVNHDRMLIKLIENMKNENIQMRNEQEQTNNKMNELQRNFDELRRQNRELKDENGEIKVEVAEIKAEKEEIKKEMEMLKEVWGNKIEDLERKSGEYLEELGGIKSTNKNLSKQVAESVKQVESSCNRDGFKCEVESIKSTNTTLINEMKEMKEMKEEMIDENIKIWNEFELFNQFVWGIDNFSTKRNKDDAICSEEFYSYKCGYKLKIECYPNGDGEGRGTHVSLFLQFIKGKFDDILEWPCKRRFFISIVNQNKGVESITNELKFNKKDRLYFYKPRPNKPNLSCGFPTIASLNDLQNSGFLIGNKMVVKVTSKE